MLGSVGFGVFPGRLLHTPHWVARYRYLQMRIPGAYDEALPRTFSQRSSQIWPTFHVRSSVTSYSGHEDTN